MEGKKDRPRVVFVVGGRVLVTGTPDPPLELSFVSQGGMVNIPLTGTGKLLSRHSVSARFGLVYEGL